MRKDLLALSIPRTYGLLAYQLFRDRVCLCVYGNVVNRLKYGKPVANAHWFLYYDVYFFVSFLTRWAFS